MKVLVPFISIRTIDAPVWVMIVAISTFAFLARVVWLARLGNWVKLVDRHSRAVLFEQAPFGSRLMHVFTFRTLPGQLLAETWLWRTYQLWMSQRMGRKYDQTASRDKLEWFTHAYGVNPEDIEKPISEYKSLNDYFIRYPRKGTRHVEYPGNDSRAVVPCDCRVVVYNSVDEAKKFYSKGTRFTVRELLQDAELANQFQHKAQVVVARLAPHDIHHFYSPVAGHVARIFSAGRWLLDQRRFGHQSPINVQTDSRREIVVLETKEFGKVAYVAIGSSMVGSILLKVKQGQQVQRGDEIGLFKYGGSTVTVLFQQGHIKFDQDLVELSAREPVWEIKTRHGASLGQAVMPEEPTS